MNKKRFMHIISGKIKGRKIECPPGEIRPLQSRVRESLFNILGNCDGKKMLDLFSGSAIISIEAFSHGIISSDIVEMDPGKKAVILRNLAHVGFTNAKVIIKEALVFTKSCQSRYDLIMLDPPFKWNFKVELIKIVSDNNLLSDNGILIIHLPKKEIIPDEIGNLIVFDRRTYGLNRIIFYKNR